MANEAELLEALRAADAAGDKEGAARIVEMLEAEAPTSTDDGTSPVPVDPAWFPEGEKFPGYTLGHELFTGVAKGVGNLPNAVPNVINAGQELYDLHFGSGKGEIAPENVYQPWMEKGPYDKSIEELNPQTPGWEYTRKMGEVSGGAAPLGPAAMVLAPAAVASGGNIGHVADILTDNTETRKWERTGEAALPLILGTGRTGRAAGVPPVRLPTSLRIGLGLTSPEVFAAAEAAAAAARAATSKPRSVSTELSSAVRAPTIPMRITDEEARKRREGR